MYRYLPGLLLSAYHGAIVHNLAALVGLSGLIMLLLLALIRDLVAPGLGRPGLAGAMPGSGGRGGRQRARSVARSTRRPSSAAGVGAATQARLSAWDRYEELARSGGSRAPAYKRRTPDHAIGLPSDHAYALGPEPAFFMQRSAVTGELVLDHYTLLGVRPTASQEDLERAYHRHVRQIHPDRFFNDPKRRADAECKLRKIVEAMEVLRDARQRAEYDAALDRGAA